MQVETVLARQRRAAERLASLAPPPDALLAWQRALGLRPPRRLVLSAAPGNGARQWAASVAARALHRARRRIRIVAVASALADAATWIDRAYALLAPDAELRSAHFACSLQHGRGEIVGLGCRSTRELDADAVIALHPHTWPANSATRMLAAIASAPGQLYVGPRAGAPEHPWTHLVDDAEDPTIRRTVYAGDGDPFDPETWRQANPALEPGESGDHGQRLLAAIAAEADRARRSPLALDAFWAGRLNAPDHATADRLCTVADLDACETDDPPPPLGPGYLGVDLGSTESLSAAVCYWPASRRLQVWAAIGDQPKPAERGARDGVGALYARAVEHGELWTWPGPVVPPGEFIARVLQAIPAEAAVAAIGADRYRRGEAEAAVRTAGYAGDVAWRGVGAGEDGAHDVRAAQESLVEHRPAFRRTLILRAALASARVERVAGNPRIVKTDRRARIDVAQALAIALGLARIADRMSAPAYHGAV